MVAADADGAPRTKIKTLKLDEARGLLELVETRQNGAKVRGHLFLKCAVQLAAFCGLRFGEVRGLTVDSIDFDGGVFEIRHSLTSLDEHKGPKTKGRDSRYPAARSRGLEFFGYGSKIGTFRTSGAWFSG